MFSLWFPHWNSRIRYAGRTCSTLLVPYKICECKRPWKNYGCWTRELRALMYRSARPALVGLDFELSDAVTVSESPCVFLCKMMRVEVDSWREDKLISEWSHIVVLALWIGGVSAWTRKNTVVVLVTWKMFWILDRLVDERMFAIVKQRKQKIFMKQCIFMKQDIFITSKRDCQQVSFISSWP